MSAWPKVRLGEVLRHRKEFITIDDLQEYRRPRVQLHAQGIVLRDTVAGTLIKTKSQQVCRAGEFLVAEIDAKVGGFGIVPSQLDGAIVSSHYFLFEIDETKLVRAFLDYFICTPAFREQVAAQGSTNYAAIRPSHVLSYEIPLPPLAEQKRVVARIEELAAKIHEARALRYQATEEAEGLAASWLNAAFSGLPPDYIRTLGDVTEIIGGNSLPDLTAATPEAPDVLFVKVSDMNRSGNETFIKDSAAGVSSSSPFLKGVRVLPERSIVFPKRGGAIATNKKRILSKPAVLDPNMMGVFTKDPSCLTQEFLFRWFASLDLASLQNGTSVPQINKADLDPLKIPVPPLAEQRCLVVEFDALQTQVDAMKRLQAETTAELDALLPAILDCAFKGKL